MLKRLFDKKKNNNLPHCAQCFFGYIHKFSQSFYFHKCIYSYICNKRETLACLIQLQMDYQLLEKKNKYNPYISRRQITCKNEYCKVHLNFIGSKLLRTGLFFYQIPNSPFHAFIYFSIYFFLLCLETIKGENCRKGTN